MDTRRRGPLRLLAPIAILAFVIALVLVLSGGSGNGGGGSSVTKAEKTRDLGPAVSQSSTRHTSGNAGSSGGALPQSVYIVKTGDTLSGIAQKTGVPINKLQDLNPGLDQFSLLAGQRIKLR